MRHPTLYYSVFKIIVIGMPILNVIFLFFYLDHSVWNAEDEDGVGVDNAKKNDNCVDLEGDNTTKNVTNEEDKSNADSTSNALTKIDQTHHTAKNTVSSSASSMGKDYCCTAPDNKCYEGSDEIRSLDLRQIEHDYEKTKPQRGSKKSFSKSIRNT
jgi:hypothetical protein